MVINQEAVVFGMPRPFCIMNSIIIFCSCTVLCWVLILTDESSGGQKAVKSGGAGAGFSVLWPQL